MEYSNHVFAVILAGGQGSRLWPVSRKNHPKQFLDLAGKGLTLLQETVRRALEITGSIHQVIVLTGRDQVSLVYKQLPDLPRTNILSEPVGRNTAPSLGLAAIHLSDLADGLSEKAVMISLPVDHMFRNEEPWFQAVRTAIQVASTQDALVAIGIKPRSPAPEYGYQHLGDEISISTTLKVHKVLKFVEKPSRQIAKGFLESGQYLWNTGTYAWRIPIFLQALQMHAPSLHKVLASLTTPLEEKELEKIYHTLENISIDHAIIEKASNVLTVRSEFERIDVGSLDSLAKIWDQDQNGNLGFGQFLSVDSKDNIVYSDEGLVSLVGVDDLVVVRTKGIILVCPRDRVQDIKTMVDQLRQKGQEDYL